MWLMRGPYIQDKCWPIRRTPFEIPPPPTSGAIRASQKLAIEAHDGPLKFPHHLRQAPLEQAKSWPLRRTTAL